MRKCTEQNLQHLKLKCDRCEAVGIGVSVRRIWGKGSDTPLCHECWQKAAHD
jgi:hypothetical protein